MVKRKVASTDDGIIVEKPEKKTGRAQAGPSVLALVPKGSGRRRAGKKGSARRPRVKNPTPARAEKELTPEEALAQAWEYTYKTRNRFQQ